MGNESRAFRMTQGLRLAAIVNAVETFCRLEKHMETQSSPTTDGYVLQASQPKDGWKTISGTRLAITVHFMLTSDVLNVTIGEGQWSDKIGAGAIGWFIAWPPGSYSRLWRYTAEEAPFRDLCCYREGYIYRRSAGGYQRIRSYGRSRHDGMS